MKTTFKAVLVSPAFMLIASVLLSVLTFSQTSRILAMNLKGGNNCRKCIEEGSCNKNAAAAMGSEMSNCKDIGFGNPCSDCTYKDRTGEICDKGGENDNCTWVSQSVDCGELRTGYCGTSPLYKCMGQAPTGQQCEDIGECN